MAIIKNGKIKGKIGRYVYRVSDGQEIVQSYPKKAKLTEHTIRAAKQFGKSSKAASRIYQQLKLFASDFTNAKFYRAIIVLLRESIYAQDKLLQEVNLPDEILDSQADPETNSWILIQDTHPLAINKEVMLNDFLDEYPVASFLEDECKVQVPAFNYDSKLGKHPREANYVEFFISVFHTHSEMTYCLHEHTSGRLSVSAGFPEQELTLPLEWMDNLEKEGIVYVSFGLSFYAYVDSRIPLNLSKFNPSALLGMWYKTNP